MPFSLLQFIIPLLVHLTLIDVQPVSAGPVSESHGDTRKRSLFFFTHFFYMPMFKCLMQF